MRPTHDLFFFNELSARRGRRVLPWLLCLGCALGAFVHMGQAATGGGAEASGKTAPQERPRMRTPGPDYRLAPLDTVQIEVFNQPDMRSEQRLTANGEIRFFLIGDVVLQGLTVREAEKRLEQLLRDGEFFIDPQVIVSVQEYSERLINVLGQVRNPTRVAIPQEMDSMGILEAITLAGGFTRIARTDKVQVTRRDAQGGEEKTIVNVQQLLDRKRPAEAKEFQLQAGDVVYVEERTL
jgi:protein involved in polysaccharide export with SLBB domain